MSGGEERSRGPTGPRVAPAPMLAAGSADLGLNSFLGHALEGGQFSQQLVSCDSRRASAT